MCNYWSYHYRKEQKKKVTHTHTNPNTQTHTNSVRNKFKQYSKQTKVITVIPSVSSFSSLWNKREFPWMSRDSFTCVKSCYTKSIACEQWIVS